MSAARDATWSPSRWLAIVFVLCAVLGNELLVQRILSADRTLEPATAWSVRMLQAAFAICAAGLYLKRQSLVTGLIIAGAALNLVAFQHKAGAVIHGRSVREGRLLELRKSLPASTHVGYVTDDRPWVSDASTERFFLTQYVLAPVVVVPESTHEWVVGNFRDVRTASVPRDLRVERDFGEGVVLFRRKP